jgi:hypothetical protein
MKRTIVYLAALAVVLATVLALHIHVYNGLNKGFTYGKCGIELVGEPGHFCGDF